MATTTSPAKNELTRDDAKQWRTRLALSLAVRVVAVLIPVAASVAATRFGAQIIHRPRSLAKAAAWWAVMLVLATVVVFTVRRVTKRLAPLATLLKLSLVFPDRAPTRRRHRIAQSILRQRATPPPRHSAMTVRDVPVQLRIRCDAAPERARP